MPNIYQNPWIPDEQEHADRMAEMAEIAEENRRFQIEESRNWCGASHDDEQEPTKP